MKELLRTNKRELFISFLAIIGLFIFIPIFTYLYFANDLKTKDTIMNKNDTGVILLDRNNRPFFTFYQAKYKNFVPLSRIPKTMQQTVIASEDKDFYKHSGFSFPSITRAFFTNMQHNDKLYGGSTITQQLVKNVLLNPKKNYLRKVQEIILAQEIERRYSKDEILEMYFNSVYFGEGAFGIENAARTYFGKHTENLTLAEQAFLAAILPSPSSLSPFSGDYKQAKLQQNVVLEKMLEQGYITKQEEERAKKEKLSFQQADPTINANAPHFALMVRDELIKKYGEENIARSGFKVRTSIDLEWQKVAEKEVAAQVEKLRPNNVSNGAAVVMDPKTGDIKALVGSTNWFDQKFGKINMATSLRSVGSSFKPIIYSAALEKRIITPATILHDAPITYGEGYRPQNYDRKFRGNVTVRRALANSLNVPAVEVMRMVGKENGLEMAKRLGINSLNEPDYYGQGLPIVLGAGEISLTEITDAYATFANAGTRAEPRLILEIEDKTKRSIFLAPVSQTSVLQPEVAFLISSILSDNKARSEVFSNLLTISRPAAVKTGTAENYRDSLTLGYTPNLTIGVWVGNSDNTPMDNVAGSLGAAPIWKNLMEKYSTGTPVQAFNPPPGVTQSVGCTKGTVAFNSNNVSRTQTASPSALANEYYLLGTEPKVRCILPSPTIPSRVGRSQPSNQPSISLQPSNYNYYNSNDDRRRWEEEMERDMQEYRRQLREARERNERFRN